MEDAKWSDTAKGLVLSAAYCASFLGAWCLSFDQWYLPAGLRAVSLLFVPYRYWPYLFAGDAAALLVMRVPKAEQYSTLWAYLSPFLLMPMVSSLALLLRNKFKTDQDKTRWLPLAALSIAVWSSISNMILNYCLYGPRASVSFANLYKFSVGDYLGILMVALPVLLFLGRNNGQVKPRHAVRDTLIAGAAIFTLYCVAAVPALEAAFHQGLLMLMLLPVVGLTFRHGWRGAAIGILAVNIVTAMKIPYMNTPGTYDAEIFVTQQALAIAATGLLMLGTVISDLFDKARVAGVAEKEALLLAQNSFLSSESKLRDQVIYMAQMQLRLDDYRDELVTWLKQHRHFEAAMDLNNCGVAHAQLFDQQALALYPMRIEAQGLYAVLNADEAAVADLARLCDGAVILYSTDADNAAVAAHRASDQGRAVLVKGGNVVLATGAAEKSLGALARLAFAQGASTPPVHTLLAAIGAAWALDIAPDLIAAGIKTFEPELPSSAVAAARTVTLPL